MMRVQHKRPSAWMLALVVATAATACGEDRCTYFAGVHVVGVLVDEAGMPLPRADAMTRLSAVKVTHCADFGKESSCSSRILSDGSEVYPSDASFEYWDDRDTIERACSCGFAGLRLSFEIPGCDPAEVAAPGGTIEDNRDDFEVDESLTVTCHSQ